MEQEVAKEMAEEVLDVFLKHGLTFGEGIEVCKTLAESLEIVAKNQEIRKD